MSNRVMTYPRSRRESEWMFPVRHHSFRRGVMSDGPRTSVPPDGVWASENVILYNNRAETRGGTKKLSASQAHFPTPETWTGISASKTGYTVTISAGFVLTSANVGDYFYWPDDKTYEIITAVDTGTNSFTSNVSTAHIAATAGRIRREPNANIWDKVNKKIVVQAGTRIYYAPWNCTSWTEAYCLSTTAPADTKSIMRQYGKNIFLWNSNGQFIIKMGDTVPVVERLNNTMISCPLTGIDETTALTYGRRYTCTMIEMVGNYLDNSYGNNTIEQESSPWAIDSNGKDYAEYFTEKPIGDESKTFARLTGGTLSATVADFAVISDAQVGITANSETNNVITDFTGCITWSDVTGRLQDSARDFWADILIYYDGGKIIIDMPNSGDSINYCTAGSGGTDISGSSYLNMRTGQGSLSTPATTEDLLVGTLQLPYSLTDGLYTFNQEYTHYRLYGTKDVGSAGQTLGNNPELYIHIEDIPIIKSFVVSTAADGTITASKGTFSQYDVGSAIYLSDGKSGAITSYTSSSVVKWGNSDITTDVGATIGSSNSFVYSQSGRTVTASKGSPFASTSVGKRIFVSDGTLSTITGYTSSTVVTVADSTTRTNVGGGIIVGPTGSSPANTRKFTDRVSDEKLSTRISKAWCKNRFWEPIPDCDIGVEIDGFFISAVKGGKAIYQTQLANSYFAGYYDPEFQIDTVPDSIQALRSYPGTLSAICSQSTISWSTEVTGTDSRPEVGLSTTFLSQRRPVDYQIGTMFPESIAAVHEGIDILFTNGCEIRLFDGKDYGPNIAEDKTMKLLRKLQPVGASSYDANGGYYLWGTEASTDSIGSKTLVAFPDTCWRFSIKESQGTIGGIKITGDDWLQPPNGVCGIEVTDDGNRTLQIVLDNLTGFYYWISTYDGPTGSNLAKTFVDKDDTTGSGTEISWSLTFGADTGSLMKYDIRHEVSNLTIDPFNPSNANVTGYDSEGFRSGLEINIYAYGKSNEWVSPYSQSLNIIKDGDITLDETQQKDDKAIQIKITGNRSECVISELVNYYTVIEQAATPTNQATSEGTYQLNLATPVLWLTRGPSLYKNRATGSSITGTASGVTGIDGKSNSAFQIASALSTISVSLTSGSILLWADGTVTATINGESVSLTSVGTSGSWTLYYATGITKTGTLVLTPEGTRKIEDVRVYNSEIASATRTYLYNDMIRNSGDNTLPLW